MNETKGALQQAWQGMVRRNDHKRIPQQAPKINLGALLLYTLDIRLARLILIFNLVLILHSPHPKEKCFVVTHFETIFLLLSKLVLSLAPWK